MSIAELVSLRGTWSHASLAFDNPLHMPPIAHDGRQPTRLKASRSGRGTAKCLHWDGNSSWVVLSVPMDSATAFDRGATASTLNQDTAQLTRTADAAPHSLARLAGASTLRIHSCLCVFESDSDSRWADACRAPLAFCVPPVGDAHATTGLHSAATWRRLGSVVPRRLHIRHRLMAPSQGLEITLRRTEYVSFR